MTTDHAAKESIRNKKPSRAANGPHQQTEIAPHTADIQQTQILNLQRFIGNKAIQTLLAAQGKPPHPNRAAALPAIRGIDQSAQGNRPEVSLTDQAHKPVQRETAEEIKQRFTNWGGFNLQEEEMADHLVQVARNQKNYTLVNQALNVIDSSDRDDVATEMMSAFMKSGPRELIKLARVESAKPMLQTMKNELGDGWVTKLENEQVDILGAVLGETLPRMMWNKARIAVIKKEAGSDLEALARIFEDDQMIDDDSVSSRLEAVLSATEHLIVPGLQTGIKFGDTGFAGDQNPGGAGFRDPHPSSRNQVGHFLTAVKLQYSPDVVSREIPMFGSIRKMVGAPAGMSDADVALRLTIGHEKAPDPSGGLEIAVRLIATGILESWKDGPEGETEEERDQRIGDAIVKETKRQVDEIIAAFKTQFEATTDDDVAAWKESLEALGKGDKLDMDAAEKPLNRIGKQINPEGKGNSVQDLRLSLVGWRLGQLIGSNAFSNNAAVASWIRSNLGASSK